MGKLCWDAFAKMKLNRRRSKRLSMRWIGTRPSSSKRLGKRKGKAGSRATLSWAWNRRMTGLRRPWQPRKKRLKSWKWSYFGLRIWPLVLKRRATKTMRMVTARRRGTIQPWMVSWSLRGDKSLPLRTKIVSTVLSRRMPSWRRSWRTFSTWGSHSRACAVRYWTMLSALKLTTQTSSISCEVRSKSWLLKCKSPEGKTLSRRIKGPSWRKCSSRQ